MTGVKDMMGVIVMLIVTIVTARTDTVMSNDYLTLDIDCKDHRIKLSHKLWTLSLVWCMFSQSNHLDREMKALASARP